jgi:hypothetical protein
LVTYGSEFLLIHEELEHAFVKVIFHSFFFLIFLFFKGGGFYFLVLPTRAPACLASALPLSYTHSPILSITFYNSLRIYNYLKLKKVRLGSTQEYVRDRAFIGLVIWT